MPLKCHRNGCALYFSWFLAFFIGFQIAGLGLESKWPFGGGGDGDNRGGSARVSCHDGRNHCVFLNTVICVAQSDLWKVRVHCPASPWSCRLLAGCCVLTRLESRAVGPGYCAVSSENGALTCFGGGCVDEAGNARGGPPQHRSRSPGYQHRVGA